MNDIARPETSEYDAFYQTYVAALPDGCILDRLQAQGTECQQLLATIDDQRALYRYADGKWSIKEVLGHLCDAERIFAYRALTIARGDRVPLPGFDENEYVAAAGFDRLPLAALAAGLAHVRAATRFLFSSLTSEERARQGLANDSRITVRALAWIIAGHERHHLDVLRERYALGEQTPI